MKYIVDRIVNGLAVCEDENMKVEFISLADLPAEIHEGSIILLENGIYSLLIDEEKKRREMILALQDGIFDE